MRLATYIDYAKYGATLYARLHLTSEEKAVLYANRRFLQWRVLTHKQQDDYEKWSDTYELSELLAGDLRIETADRGDAHDLKVALEKSIIALEKDITLLIPPPPPAEPKIDYNYWFAHCVLIAQNRFGKTNILCCRLRDLIPLIAEGKATVVLMEPKGSLINAVLRLRAVWKLSQQNRLVIIDPSDTLVSVNVFDRGDGSPQAVNATIDRLERLFGLITSNLTPLQRVPLSMAIRALFAMDAAPSMDGLKAILRKGIDPALLPRLPKAVAEFFWHDFAPQHGKPDARATELIGRLNGILANPTFEALFSATHSTFNMLEKIQEGSLIIINANPVAIGGNAELFGRYWIEDVRKCIYPRLAAPDYMRTPTIVIIDEAQDYVSQDRALAGILDKAAEAKIGMLFAIHHLGQIEDTRVRNSILTNTALKFAAKTSAEIHDLMRSMGSTDAEFINTLRQYEFAFFGPNMTHAQRVKFPLMDFTKLPKMSDEQYAEMRRRNREQYGYRPDDPQSPPEDRARRKRKYDDKE
jgi:hypothetical protein